jgi:hypothetical protein
MCMILFPVSDRRCGKSRINEVLLDLIFNWETTP